MAKIAVTPLLEDIRGKLGNLSIRRSRKGRFYLANLPDMSNVKWSDAQKAHRQRFKEAVAYAKAAMADPQVRAHYEQVAAEANRTPFSAAVSDYFKGRDLLEP